MALVVPVDLPPHEETKNDPSIESSARNLFVRSTVILRSSRRLLQGKAEAVIVELDRREYILSWTLLLLARGACTVYCLGAAGALLVLHHPFMIYYAELLQPGLRPVLVPTDVLYALVTVAHTIKVPRMVPSCLRRKRTKYIASSSTSACGPWRFVVERIWRPLFSRRGFFGVESKYYEARYAVRETIEIIAQSVQAYTSSVLIGQPWINNVYIAIVVINCTSTLIIQQLTKIFRWSLPKERLACVVVDTVLDAGTAVILPVILVYPYLISINLEFYSFDIELVYNDVWFIALINENRQIFPLGVMDLAFKFFPQVSLFLSVGSIGSILQLRQRTLVEKDESTVQKVAAKSLFVPSPTPTESHTSKWLTTLHKCFVVWGFALVACHIVAVSIPHPNLQHQMDGCMQQLHPWFVVKSACTVYNFNCYRRETDTMGDASRSEADALDFLDAKSLSVLIASHCSALRVTPSIQRFPNLMGFEIYNSTLVEWSEQAALTSTTHPTITYVFIICTNLSGIPLGLLHSDLPPTLMDIEFSTTNLSSVPPDLHVRWRNVITLYIEHSQLQTIPDTLLKMKLDDFSIIGNGIKQLPNFSVRNGNYFMLALAANPITNLPSSAEYLKNVGFLNLVDTEIGTLPDWMNGSGGSSSRVFLTGTPFCNAKSAADIDDSFDFNSPLSCTYSDRRIRSRYPLQITSAFLLP